MKLVTSEEIKRLEERLEREYSIPPILLMENAASFLFSFLKEKFEDIENRKIAILCGPGNNGGDGVALARYLYSNGIRKITIFSYLWGKKISDLLKIQLGLLKNLVEIKDILQDYTELKEYELIVDGIFGIGLKREIDDDLKKIFRYINNLGKKIISIDIPSGINSDTGEIMGEALRADYVLTMFLPKVGLFETGAVDYVGEVIVGRLGIPIEIVNDIVESNIHLVDWELLKDIVRIPSKGVHKGKKGKVLIIGGSFRYTGAPILSALSALRTGAGMVYLAVPEKISMVYRGNYPEIIYIPLKDKDGYISYDNLGYILEIIETYGIEAVAIGPGIGINEDVRRLVQDFLRKVDKKVVVDADALSFVKDILGDISGKDVVFTPHYGEMSRIVEESVETISKKRVEIGRNFVERYKLNLIIKGPNSLFFDPKNHVYVNPFADFLLATAGSGDVLTGIIAGFSAQGYSLKEACILGNFVHGYSSVIWKKYKGSVGLTASDIIKILPLAIDEVIRRRNV
ncbi:MULTISPECIES: NAD(P)H-hydrate dehydratase [Dictyoglomus]|uniref:Bifunctional NAD(P)H-hydrate repair enzyme Nnr n=1 Tax=Dictyoglomus turgidum (strain DSM 6724 / Z-1310) TaxID=515635 RepID=NNR_DICTD|nr:MULTISPECIES: NAD(P)H-hydrate dehydratase [Dictyoglomus]B8E2P6.1 RecName: Full=Bifunctional NAD(P)H-hydrate repair enzyme Nnr; AltName: Full=Nicotinamide nucleotide repair protein; Includes: RecName: Full=ADP-dependent (S)-NAD(P)H-hydrate dehydratase; AltName: Full=ADP-dependent NAD(P)HX dehydratase; Includes: RecName: Full=NAD(P)H-hydrate epimerase; AltName: Full=NAD(P)HX epimerase [Dictyoglomus turgidum DSM 6724]ACK42890.1 carbohydrate kinase, YjeF related protein [Dictyoglomus turgidum DSM 